MPLATVLRGALRWLGRGLLLFVVLVTVAFGVLQTPLGLGWAARWVASMASSPGFAVTVRDLEGTIPFDMRARRIEIADDRGAWLTLADAHIDIAAAGLLGGQLHLRQLTAREIDIVRPPEPATPTPATPPVPLSELLRVPRAPVAIILDRLAVGRLALGPAILGERVEATIDGRAELRGTTAEIVLDLRRSDNIPGNLALELRQRADTLALKLTASEPTGLLLGRVLNRADRPPLSASLTGEGPLSGWRGRFEVAAGQLARLAGELTIAADTATTVSLTGTAAVAPLLPPAIAALTGDSMPIAMRATLREDGAVALDALSVEMAAGRLSGNLMAGGPRRTIAGQIKASLPDLASASGLLGQPVRGAAELVATLSGTEERPRLRLDVTGNSIGAAASGVDRAEARLTVGWSEGSPARIEIAANGRLTGIAMPDGVPRDLGRDVDWTLAARATPDASSVDITEFTVRGAGADVAGTATIGGFGQQLDGSLRVSVADLRPFTGMSGHPVEGRIALNAAMRQQTAGQIDATLDGAINGLKAGIPAVDALAGESVVIAGAAQRDAIGLLRLTRLAVTGAGVSLAAAGNFDPATRQVAATLDVEVRDLRPVGAAAGAPLSGKLTAHVAADGPADRLRLQARLEGENVAASGTVLDRAKLDLAIADLTQPRVALSGDFRSGGLDGRLSLEAEQPAPNELAIRQLRIAAAGGTVEADLRVDLKTLLTRGTARAALPDLAPWSRLAGMPLAGRLDLRAALEARGGQSLDLTLNGERLATGAGGGRIGLAQVAITARLNDLLGAPSGNGRATLSGATFSSGTIATAMLTLDSPRPGRFTFGAEAKGRVIDPLTIALDGSGEIAPQNGAVEIRLARLSGALGPDRFQLTQPLTLSKRGNDLTMTSLAFSVGGGQITGSASRRGAALAADLAARNLSIVPAARLAGYRDVGGTLSGEVNVGGTLSAPQGRFKLAGRELRLALPKQRLPTLGVDLSGNWNGRDLTLNGRVSGIKGDRLELSGSAPLVLTPAMAVSVPPQGRLALRLQGAGDLGNLADLLPLGEDRVSGRFALDGEIGGTPAAPVASGRLTISDGRYENFASGAVLTRMKLDIAGDRDRLTVREFSAGDTANGTLAGRGSVILAATGPSAEVSLTMNGFRIVARDDAVLTASGTVAIAGSVAAPKVTVRLMTDQGDVTIPDQLPPSVTQLQVVEVNGRTPSRRASAAAPAKPAQPALPASLDIRIAVPGRVFVRGRGLDSEWRGQVSVTGTSDQPRIAGGLEAVRGTFDILGKTFKVVRGHITLDGGAAIDPTLDIAAEIAAADIVARVLVHGPASAPRIEITSTPVVPQDEILSRVLFNRAVGQITAAEGIQVAQAAATLAGGGPGVLDRLRGRLGLDRLVFGSGPGGAASSNLNPAAGGSAASGTSISGGKYVAEGVYVGASQGLTPQSSKVIVEIEVRPRVTVQGDFSQSGGSGLGLNYKYDY